MEWSRRSGVSKFNRPARGSSMSKLAKSFGVVSARWGLVSGNELTKITKLVIEKMLLMKI